MRTVHEAVEDRITKGGVPDQFVPVLDGELAGHERGPTAVAIFDDFQHVTPFAIAERCQAPVIEYQEFCFLQGGQEFAVGAVGPGELQGRARGEAAGRSVRAGPVDKHCGRAHRR